MQGLLGHPLWAPLARLSYPIYLVAMQVQEITANLLRAPRHFSHLDKVGREAAGDR